MTETGLATCNGLTDPEEKVIGTDGLPLPGMALRVVDDAERDVPTGSEGDLLVKGPAQFVGYWKRPEFTREGHTADSWVKPVDRSTLDPDGYVSINEPSKHVVIRGGRISRRPRSRTRSSPPKIAGVAVVAMPDPRLQGGRAPS
jgi:cyclohexanecarboxylate-CoA ligase